MQRRHFTGNRPPPLCLFSTPSVYFPPPPCERVSFLITTAACPLLCDRPLMLQNSPLSLSLSVSLHVLELISPGSLLVFACTLDLRTSPSGEFPTFKYLWFVARDLGNGKCLRSFFGENSNSSQTTFCSHSNAIWTVKIIFFN